MKVEDSFAIFVIGAWLLSAIATVAALGLVAYGVIHFAAKFW